ncbi:glycoside hydrolase family 75 protein [Nostoc sp. DedQUE09]|uniref:glycoside hydrolase family 75 protein n=1 Tax=Nostoc sp. DedQUE09 TaxID=3075394 RepID=UPI002AD1DD0E|nr:glycoside hydrolase family 75 protein [Nostoc sp. DedQUE09]MDZ7956156.1 glycoside hydrolase family 75 protein [Nostoc sp. DedQUE09]
MQQFQVTSDSLNIRSAPIVNEANQIAVLPKGCIVSKIIQNSDNDKWWKVATILEGKTLEGFVAQKFLSPVTKFSIKTVLKIGEIPILRANGESAFFYEAGMSINADGAPNAYHPADKGIDFLANAGSPGNWWALAVDKNGNPFIQGSTDPFPGYYISTTALFDSEFVNQDPRRYVDSAKIPYIVLPGNGDFRKATGVKLGDFAVVYNTNNEKLAFAIYADVGPKNQIGEGSIALSQALGNDPLVRSRVRQGIPKDIVYIVFPGSGNGKARTISEIEAETKRFFEIWGGVERIKSL